MKKTKLKYFRHTRQLFENEVKHDLGKYESRLLRWLALNQKSYQSGKIEKLDIEDIAEAIGCSLRHAQRALHRLTKVGLYLPEKWGKISGSLPQMQLDNHRINADRDHARHEQFYKELDNRITKAKKQRSGPLPERMIESIFLALCKERKENNKFFPDLGGGAARNKILDEMSLYLPDSSLSDD